MTFRDYIITLTKFYNRNQNTMILQLFKEAGCSQGIPQDTARSWISTGKKERHCTIKDYFPNGSINESNLVYFF